MFAINTRTDKDLKLLYKNFLKHNIICVIQKFFYNLK